MSYIIIKYNRPAHEQWTFFFIELKPVDCDGHSLLQGIVDCGYSKVDGTVKCCYSW